MLKLLFSVTFEANRPEFLLFGNPNSHEKVVIIRPPEIGFVGVCGKPDFMKLATGRSSIHPSPIPNSHPRRVGQLVENEK